MEPIINLQETRQNESLPNLKEEKSSQSGHGVFIVITFVLLIIASVGLGAFYAFLFAAPVEFVPKTIVHIDKGQSVQSIATTLADAHIIQSPEVFSLFVRIRRDSSKLHQGEYFFEKAINVSEVIDRIVSADYGIENVRVLIPEGYTRKDMSQAFTAQFPNFSADDFMNETKNLEGYLFPDTYRFFRTATSGEIVADMQKTFALKTADLHDQAVALGKNWSDVMVVASLVELEGKTAEDRGMIADIIYRRLAQNMPLQLDAPFLYIMDKASLHLTQEDLFTQSPYNTYRNKGLPPTPIASPGVESINAALHPIANDYLYYLSDKDGIVHYAKSFDEHRKNKLLYLK